MRHADVAHQAVKDVEAGGANDSPDDSEALPTPPESPRRERDTLLLNAPERRNSQTPAEPLLCFCFDLARLSVNMRFAVLAVGVFFFFLLNSWVEEYTFKQLPKFRFGWYLTFFELMCFSVFAILERLFISHEPVIGHAAPLTRHLIVAAAMTASRGLTNVSLQFLNYPTQIIFKSMKLITVMIGSLFILNATFTLYEYASAVCLVLAAIAFSLGDTEISADVGVPVTGIAIVLLSLVGDALHSTTQDSLLREHKASTSEAMLFTNFYAACASLVYILGTGELWEAIAYCQRYPQAYALFVLRSAVIYLGVLCFILTIKSFGVVLATGVTTVRKILSILLSFLFFPKKWSAKYFWGGVLFSASLLLTVVDQREKMRLRALDAEKKRRGAGPAV